MTFDTRTPALSMGLLVESNKIIGTIETGLKDPWRHGVMAVSPVAPWRQSHGGKSAGALAVDPVAHGGRSGPLDAEVVVGIRRLDGWTLCLGNVHEVDADAVPRRRATAVRVDEHVLGRELREDLRIARLPLLEPRKCVGLLLRLRDRDQRQLRTWRLLRRGGFLCT